MKKLLTAIAAILILTACGDDQPQVLMYRGLPMDLPFQTFIDSLKARGFEVDSAHSDSAFQTVILGNPAEKYRLALAQIGGEVTALQENYHISTNDSTRRLWQQLRDDFEKELGAWPNMPKHGDDHKIAKFEAKGGFITITLENTYKPTLSVLYQRK